MNTHEIDTTAREYENSVLDDMKAHPSFERHMTVMVFNHADRFIGYARVISSEWSDM